MVVKYPGPIHMLLLAKPNLYFVKCNDHTKAILHAFGFDALASVNVNFSGLFPRLLQVNVNLCLFHLVARQSLFFKHLMMLLLLPSVSHHILR